MTISIKKPETTKEYDMVEWLQAQIWGNQAGVVPAHMLLTFAKEGGLVLLMLDDAAPVGFAFGFPGLTAAGQVKLASHQAGVLPAYQSQGWGHRLKLAQREAALAQGFNLMTWTFDPLQGRNARLNMRKLGAVCNTYIINLYGDMDDSLNQGLPSDRFRVEWWLNSEHVIRRIAGSVTEPENWLQAVPVLNSAQSGSGGFLVPPNEPSVIADAPLYLVEIPNDLAQLKAALPQAALTWRLQTRQLFKDLLAQGYTAVDLLRSPAQRNYVLLQKDWPVA